MVIETHALTKQYRRAFAVRDLDLAVPEGAISAFLGPNGSGKTTTIRMLLGLARPSAGVAFVLGCSISNEMDAIAIRRRTAYVAEDKRVYGYMTVRQMLDFMRSVYSNWNRDRERVLRERFDLPLDRACKKLSKGMRTKLALVLALSRQLDLLILDEPSEGLDPGSAEQLLECVVEAAADGATVFFSTHQISEVERIADHVFIMSRGQLVFQSRLDTLAETYRRVHVAFPGRPPLEDMSLDAARSVRVEGHVLSFVATGDVERITQRARALGAISVHLQPFSLREVFLETTKESRA